MKNTTISRIKNSTKSKFYDVTTAVLVISLVILNVLTTIQVNHMQKISATQTIMEQINSNIQRLIRMEVVGEPNDELIAIIEQDIEDLEGQIYILNENISQEEIDKNYERMDNIKSSWEDVKLEIEVVREKGWEATHIVFSAEMCYYYVEALFESSDSYFNLSAEILKETRGVYYVITAGIILAFVSRFVQYTGIVKKSAEIEKAAFIDTPTGIYNRAKCESLLSQTKLTLEYESILAVFDLNDLKKVNDELGHIYGDKLIAGFATLLKTASEIFEEPPFVARYGGDEFIVFFEKGDKENIEKYLNKLKSLRDNHNQAETAYKIQYAVGSASSVDIDETDCVASVLMRYADINMYEDKRAYKKLMKQKL